MDGAGEGGGEEEKWGGQISLLRLSERNACFERPAQLKPGVLDPKN